MAKTERLRRSFFPQAIRLLNSVSKHHYIHRTQFNKLYTHPLFSIIHTAAMCTYPVQPICTFSCTSVFFINIYYPQYTVLHILSHCTSYSFYFIICSLFHSHLYLYIYIFSCVMFHCFIAYVIFISFSILLLFFFFCTFH